MSTSSNRDEKGRFVSAEDVEVTVEEAVAETSPVKKVAIVGFTYSRELAPYDDPSFEIWACNNLWRFIQRFDRLYDLHDDETIASDADHSAFLRGETRQKADGTDIVIGDRPILVWKPREEWAQAFGYPKDAVLDAFKHLQGGRYFTNSISWMIAHAICEGAKEIHVYGVDMAQGSEYSAQRPSCEYWLGFAEALGIKVFIPDTSDLLKCAFLYGVDDDGPIFTKMNERAKELKARLAAIQQQQQMITQQQQEFRDAQMQLMGALEDCGYWKGTWLAPHANRDGSAKDAEGLGASMTGG